MKTCIYSILSLFCFFLHLSLAQAQASQQDLQNELFKLLPKTLDTSESRDRYEAWAKLYGKASMIEGEWHYYSLHGVNYPLALKVRKGKVVGGNFHALSPYQQILTYSQLQEHLKTWTRIEPSHSHDLGRYYDYQSKDLGFAIRFKAKGNDGMVESFKWGENE